VPDLDGAVFRSRDDDGEGGMEDGEGDVSSVRFESLNAGLGVIVPDLDGSVGKNRKDYISASCKVV